MDWEGERGLCSGEVLPHRSRGVDGHSKKRKEETKAMVAPPTNLAVRVAKGQPLLGAEEGHPLLEVFSLCLFPDVGILTTHTRSSSQVLSTRHTHTHTHTHKHTHIHTHTYTHTFFAHRHMHTHRHRDPDTDTDRDRDRDRDPDTEKDTHAKMQYISQDEGATRSHHTCTWGTTTTTTTSGISTTETHRKQHEATAAQQDRGDNLKQHEATTTTT